MLFEVLDLLHLHLGQSPLVIKTQGERPSLTYPHHASVAQSLSSFHSFKMPSTRVRFAPDTIPLLEDSLAALANSHLAPIPTPERHQQIIYVLKGFKRDSREFHQTLNEIAGPSSQPDLPLRRLRAILSFHSTLLDELEADHMKGQLRDVVEWLDMILEYMRDDDAVCLPLYLA